MICFPQQSHWMQAEAPVITMRTQEIMSQRMAARPKPFANCSNFASFRELLKLLNFENLSISSRFLMNMRNCHGT